MIKGAHIALASAAGALALIVAVVIIRALPHVQERMFMSDFRDAVIALSWEAKARAEDVPTYEERDRFFIRYIESMQAVIRDHRRHAPPTA